MDTTIQVRKHGTLTLPAELRERYKISDHQQSWGYEDGPWKGPGPPAGGR